MCATASDGRCDVSPPGPIPGGWSQERITIGEHALQLTLPADADAFLEDAETLAESHRSGETPYWPYLWPAARVMAERVLAAEWPPKWNVLEIGCGIGLVGLAALQAGHHVTFSDYRPEAVALAVHNARSNGFDAVEGLVFNWRDPPAATFDALLGCEVIYEQVHHAPVLNLIDVMLNPNGLCWIGDPGRHTVDRFLADAQSGGLSVRQLDRYGHPSRNLPPGEFRLIELRKP